MTVKHHQKQMAKKIEAKAQKLDNNKASLIKNDKVPNKVTFEKVTYDLMHTVHKLQDQMAEFQINKHDLMEPQTKRFFLNTKMPPNNNTLSVKPSSNPSTNTHTAIVRRPPSPYTAQKLLGASENTSNNQQSLLKMLQEEVQNAIKNRKTFTIEGNWSPVRRALLQRNWVEKMHHTYKDLLSDNLKKYLGYQIPELLPLASKPDLSHLVRRIIKSKLLVNHQVDLFWGLSVDSHRPNPDSNKITMINKFRRNIFCCTTKTGLCEAAKNSYWFEKEGFAQLNHPRSYTLGKDESNFWDDFHTTSVFSLLKYIVDLHNNKKFKIVSPSGRIPLEVFDFAINECCKYIKRKRNQDIDENVIDATAEEWNLFLDFFFKMVYLENHFRQEHDMTQDILVMKAKLMLDCIRPFYPCMDVDGFMNIWILKPIASSRGRGIHICRTKQYIIKTIRDNPERFVAQKYIERPLLIYNTKFDIRQWFLISNTDPLTIWMYKECYLRFSSQTYTLRKLHESIHLTNNSVQSKYKNSHQDAALPNYNMWDLNQFQNYLSNIGFPQAYSRITYPGMKQNIIAASLINEEQLEKRPNSFELYGADFMVTEDFKPWIIEINSSPALYASTPVTARLCPKVLEDVVRVVIDYKFNIKANTGGFELIYRAKNNSSNLPAVCENMLQLKGKTLNSSYFYTHNDANVKNDQRDLLRKFGKDIKDILTNVLRLVKQFQNT